MDGLTEFGNTQPDPAPAPSPSPSPSPDITTVEHWIVFLNLQGWNLQSVSFNPDRQEWLAIVAHPRKKEVGYGRASSVGKAIALAWNYTSEEQKYNRTLIDAKLKAESQIAREKQKKGININEL